MEPFVPDRFTQVWMAEGSDTKRSDYRSGRADDQSSVQRESFWQFRARHPKPRDAPHSREERKLHRGRSDDGPRIARVEMDRTKLSLTTNPTLAWPKLRLRTDTSSILN